MAVENGHLLMLMLIIDSGDNGDDDNLKWSQSVIWAPIKTAPVRLAVCFGKKDLSSLKQKSSVERALATEDDDDLKLASKQHWRGLMMMMMMMTMTMMLMMMMMMTWN